LVNAEDREAPKGDLNWCGREGFLRSHASIDRLHHETMQLVPLARPEGPYLFGCSSPRQTITVEWPSSVGVRELLSGSTATRRHTDPLLPTLGLTCMSGMGGASHPQRSSRWRHRRVFGIHCTRCFRGDYNCSAESDGNR